MAGFSADLRALAEALDLGPQHLAAFSLGAFVALRYADDNPAQVRSLTFFNFSQLGYSRVASAVVPGMLDIVFNRALRPIERRGLWWLPFGYARMVLAKNTPPLSDILLGTLSLRCCDPQAVRVSARELARREVLEAVPEQIGGIEAMIAFRSYQISFGTGAQVGDGVVPTAACYLEGADNLVLEGARHAPYNAPSSWYGAREVIPLWFD